MKLTQQCSFSWINWTVGEISNPALIPTVTGDPSYRLAKISKQNKTS